MAAVHGAVLLDVQSVPITCGFTSFESRPVLGSKYGKVGSSNFLACMVRFAHWVLHHNDFVELDWACFSGKATLLVSMMVTVV